MKIDSYSIVQNSSHSLKSGKTETENIQIMTSAEEKPYSVDIKNEAYSFHVEKTNNNSLLDKDEIEKDPRIKLIESLIYLLTGKRVTFKPQTAKIGRVSAALPDINLVALKGVGNSGVGMVYEYQEVVTEQESVKFSSAGYLTLSGGRTVSFDIEFSMSREFYSRTDLTLRLGNSANAVDPLVVVFGNGAPTLTSKKYAFDLDADGVVDNISFATKNSGFLAIDKNGDGVINDGTELFGPKKKNGFLELKQYDTDGNGWIDENDEVFKELLLLTMSDEGEKTLFKLSDVGIGAIYLNDVTTQFSLKDDVAEYGEMKSSSVFIREDGSAGAIHHIDLTI